MESEDLFGSICNIVFQVTGWVGGGCLPVFLHQLTDISTQVGEAGLCGSIFL